MDALAKMTISIALLLSLAACGGGDSGGSGDASATSAPAQAGSADIDASGGTVTATFDGGATATLTVPPGALVAKTSFRLDPVTTPAGALAGLQVTPSALQFRVPATLVVTLPSNGSTAADTELVLDTGTQRLPLASTIDAQSRTLTASITYLGSGAAVDPFAALLGTSVAASRRATTRKATAKTATAQTATDTTALQIALARTDFDGDVTILQGQVAVLLSNGSRDNAIDVQTAMSSVLGNSKANTDARVRGAIGTWRGVVCAQQQFAISALKTFDVASDYRGFMRRAADVLIWDQLAEQLNQLMTLTSSPVEAGCANLPDTKEAPVRDRFPDFVTAAQAALGLLDPISDFEQLLSVRIPELLNFAAGLEQFTGIDDLEQSVRTLIADQDKRLRASAYQVCHDGISQGLQQELLQHVVGDATFEPLSPFNSDDLIEDIQTCGMPIHWAVKDVSGHVLQQGDAGGTGPGAAIATATMPMTGAATIVLSGPLSALRCPVSSANNEQLLFVVGPKGATGSTLAQLTPANDDGYLETSDLTFTLQQLQALAQPAGANGNGQLVVTRQGGTCNGDFPRFDTNRPIVTFTLNFTGGSITPTSLGTGQAKVPYGAQMRISGGGTAPFTWSASGLPAGLSIDAASGIISGTPNAEGSVTVTITATSSDGVVTREDAPLVIKPARTLTGTAIIEAFDDNCGFNRHGTYTGNIALTQTGDHVSGTSVVLVDEFHNCDLGQGYTARFEATVGYDAFGNVLLTDVTLTLTTGSGCQEVPQTFAGPLFVERNTVDGFTDPPISSRCIGGVFSGFQLLAISGG